MFAIQPSTTVSVVSAHHKEGSSVVVLLQELVFAFRGFVGDDFTVVAKLSPALFLCEAVESLNL